MRGRIVWPVVLATALIAGILAAFSPLTTIDGVADDAAAAFRVGAVGPRDMSGAAVTVLLLDEKSVNTPPLSNMPRALMSPVWAALGEKALGHGARAVAYDFILAFDAAQLALGEERPLKTYDASFLKLLFKEARRGRVVIGRSKDLAPARRFAAVARDSGVAFVDLAADPDGVARRMRPGFTLADRGVAPTLSGALLGVQEVAPIQITPPAPLTALPTASVIDVLACNDAEALKRLFADRFVLVGSGLPGEDRLRAPDRFMPRTSEASAHTPCDFPKPDAASGTGGAPGVYLHAAAVDARISGWELKATSPLVVGVLVGVVAALAALMGLGLHPATAAAGACGLAVLGFGAAAFAQEAGALFPAGRPAMGALIGFAGGWAGRLLFLDRRARALRQSFGRYVAPELVEKILAQDRLPKLEGERRHVAIMFADLSGFTALSEQVDGETLTATVNSYLGVIAREVERTGGYVDKFIGDAVMAMWNAPADLPDHERAAVLAAVAIRDAVAEAAEIDKAKGLPSFAIKIGVNSGQAIVGNVGAENRLNYTAVGDTVNIAARMEGLPSVFLTPIVLGADCAKAAAQDFAMLEIASIQVKGRQEPVAVFAPYGAGDKPWFRDYEAALAQYRARDFAGAAAGWRSLAEEDWSGAELSSAMAEFAEVAAEERLDPDWSGAVVMKTK